MSIFFRRTGILTENRETDAFQALTLWAEFASSTTQPVLRLTRPKRFGQNGFQFKITKNQCAFRYNRQVHWFFYSYSIAKLQPLPNLSTAAQTAR
ncbi:MAG: hypothetical protein BHW37_05665 [Firmicutes bacterium CAG:272_52_7]|nr:MAG: hypothetical protein BHW37_05665 [Firmicutes bacterium CAG:272_52_7]